ncbi:MAG: DUF1127 domain-containing protein [Pseudomonadota bacterium]
MANCNDTIAAPEIMIRGASQTATTDAQMRKSGRIVIASIVTFLVAALYHWQKKSRDLSMMSRLDDRMLKDIGMTRADLDGELSRSLWSDFPEHRR